MELVKYLEEKKCFKLICGAGNQDLDEITKLSALYAAAGCRFFDVNASVEAVKAAKEGFRIVNKENECFICVSVGTKNDPHLSKCKINQTVCNKCGLCKNSCIQQAINNKNILFVIDEKKCIGCKKCLLSCPANAIESYYKNISFEKVLPSIIEEGIDCIEYHAISENEDEIISGWNTILKIYKGTLSVSINRSKLGTEQLISCLNRMKNCTEKDFIVQADGLSMSGGVNNYRSTLQAIATADIIERANITPYIIVSGGTNEKTMNLAKKCGLDISGFAAGSYARKIIKKYIDEDNFLQNPIIFNKALEVAKELVNSI